MNRLRKAPFDQNETFWRRRIWVLASSREDGLETSTHATEREAYKRLADMWFPNFDKGQGCEDHIANHCAMLAALDRGVAEAKEWFEEYQLSEDTPGEAIIKPHDIPSTSAMLESPDLAP